MCSLLVGDIEDLAWVPPCRRYRGHYMSAPLVADI